MIQRGIYTALVTPFTKDDMLDIEAFHSILSLQQKAGIHGVVVGGTTGESALLSQEELLTLLNYAKEYSMPVIAGIGSASTTYSVTLAKACSLNHVDALLLVTPYYNKPTQEGIYRHVEAIVAVTEKPIILYNVPSRTASQASPETLLRLREAFPNHIIGVKEASQDMLLFSKIRSLCGEDFLLLTGDDATLYPSLTVGSHGAISVISNVIPEKIMKLFYAWEKSDILVARKIHEDLQEIIHQIFIETNPIPVKYALSFLGYIQNYLRLPLTPLSKGCRKALEEALVSYVKR